MVSRAAADWEALEEASAAKLDKAAGGWLGYEANSADQTGITTSVALTGLSVTVTANTSRRLLILATGSVGCTATGYFRGRIRRDGSNIGTWISEDAAAALSRTSATGFALDAPSAGSHDYDLTLGRTSGTATLDVIGTSPENAKILVIDLGSVT